MILETPPSSPGCAAVLLLALAGHAAAAVTTRATTGGRVSGAVTTSCNETDNGGAAGASSSCLLTDSPGGTNSALVTGASVSPGVLRVEVRASFVPDYPQVPLVNLSAGGSGSSSASFADQLTFSSPGLQGHSGTVFALFEVRGRASADVAGIPAPNIWSTGNDSVARVSYGGQIAFGRGPTVTFSGQELSRIDPPHADGPSIAGRYVLSTPITFGSPVALSAAFSVSWDAMARRVLIFSGPGGARDFVGHDDSLATIDASFGHTLYWGGITRVLDATGREVAFDLSAQSGADYRSAMVVPAPPPAWTLAAGLLALAWRRRRVRPTPTARVSARPRRS